MRGMKFNMMRETWQKMLTMDNLDKELAEVIVKSLPITEAQKTILRYDLLKCLEYRAENRNLVRYAERIANGKGWTM